MLKNFLENNYGRLYFFELFLNINYDQTDGASLSPMFTNDDDKFQACYSFL